MIVYYNINTPFPNITTTTRNKSLVLNISFSFTLLHIEFQILGSLLAPAFAKFNPKDYEAAAMKAAESKAEASCEKDCLGGQVKSCSGGGGGGGWGKWY